MNKKLITVSEAAQLLSLSVDTIRRWDKKGLIKASRGNNNQRFFDLSELKRAQIKYKGGSTTNNYKMLKTNKKTDISTMSFLLVPED